MTHGRVHLAAEDGAVIGYTLPLSEHVEKQWRAGELVRVHRDGTPWDEAGDDPDARDGGSAEPGGDDGIPARPRDTAHRRHWQAYAVAIGACTQAEADGMTKAALVELVTPPEEKPAGPEG
jgi:hypothetical protein